MWPVDFFDRIGVWLLKPLERLEKREQYVYLDGKIVQQRGRSVCDEIPMDDVVEWSIVPIIGFDVVRIHLKQGTLVEWIDWDESLIYVLRQHVGSKMQG